jgi:CSLREA domain-containing protein
MRARPRFRETLGRWARLAALAVIGLVPPPAAADHNGCTPPPIGPAVCNVTATPATAQQGGNLTVGWQGAAYTEYSVRVCRVASPNNICVESPSDWVLVPRTPGTPGNPSSVSRTIPACLSNGFYKAKVNVWLGQIIDFAYSGAVTIANGTAPCVTNVTMTPTTVGQAAQQTVRWSATNQASYAVLLFNQAGTTLVHTIQPRTTSTTQSHTWTVPFSVQPGTYKIKVQVWNGSNVAGEALSSGTLTVTPTPQVGGVVVSPTSVQTGAPLTISWSSTNQHRFEVFRCGAGGTGCSGIVGPTTSGAQTATWQVPSDLVTGTYTARVRVTSTSGATAEALSGPFTVKAVWISHETADTHVPESSGQTFTRILMRTSDGSPLTAQVAVSYATVDGTAQAGSDYTATAGTLTFPVNTPSGSVQPTASIPLAADTTQEPVETFRTVFGTCAGCALDPTRPEYAQHVFNILDDDTRISIGDQSVTESDAGSVLATLTVSLQVPPSQPVSLSWATVPGTARPERDFRTASGVVVFNPGQPTSQTIQVEVLPDTLDEDNEVFHVDLASPVNGRILDGRGDVTILDNDPLPMVSIGDCPSVEGNQGPHDCVFLATLSAPSGRVVTVTAATADGTAVAGADYTARTSVVTFPEETVVRTVGVPVLGDLSDEPNETFFVRLSGQVNADIGDGEGVGLITDDDDPPLVTIRDVSVTDREFHTVAHLKVELSVPSGFTVSVNYATRPGTATAGQDFVPATGTLVFPPGTPKLTVAVPIVPDLEDEGVETFTVELSGAVNATIADGVAVASIGDRPRPLACSGRLDPADDGTGLLVDLVVSEVAPGQHIELYNPSASPMPLWQVAHRLMSPPFSVPVATLAPDAIAPARGYVTLPWPGTFPAPIRAHEIVLYRDADTANPQKIVNYACWGDRFPPERKDDAEQVGKWSGDCAEALSDGAIHRMRGTPGTGLASFDTVSGPSPRSCAAVFTVNTLLDTLDGRCDGQCSLREAVEAANAAPGPDTILLPDGILLLQRPGAGEDLGETGDLDVRSDITIVGSGAKSTQVINDRLTAPPPDDRLIHVAAGARLAVRGVTLRQGASTDDGGAVLSAGTLGLRDVEVRGSAAAAGGALAVIGPGASAVLRGVTLTGNHAAGDGGGLAVSGAGARVDLLDSTVSGNGAGGSGGGLFHGAGAAVTLNNVTITGNRADEDQDQAGDGGGTSGEAGSQVTFANTVLAGNIGRTGGPSAPDCDGACGAGCLASSGYNFVGSNVGCGFPAAAGDQVGTGTPVGLRPLADNKGPTRTHDLLAGSPLLDAAHPAPPGSGAPACSANDQRSFRRPWIGVEPGAPRCDIGSLESCRPVFEDVPGTSPFAPLIAETYCRGITGGCGSNPLRYCPGDPISRQGMAVFLVVALQEAPSGALHNAYFDDVPDNAFAPFINRLYELGITSGCGVRAYCPGNAVTRGEMAVFLVSALEEAPSPPDAPDHFKDIANHPFRTFINRIYELGITGGCGNGAYCPGDPVSREAMAAFLMTAFFSY